LVDLQLSFPFMILAIGILAATGPSFAAVIVLFVLARWPAYARLARGSVLEVKERAFVAAAQALGAGDIRILFRHVTPSCVGPLLVLASFELAGVIIAEASLGFLGVGIAPPTPTWGNMLAGSRNYLRTAWWLVVFPGLAISLTALTANLAGDHLRDYFDPRTRRHQ
jgi:peptide/nickel transport system permease protein